MANTKPHPSCKLPNIATPPGLTDYFKNLALKAAASGLPNVTKLAATVKRLNDFEALAQQAIDRHAARVKKLAKFSCPLPNVSNKNAGIPTP